MNRLCRSFALLLTLVMSAPTICHAAREKWVGDPNAAKHLTMDVKLKREYNMGWIINAQGGPGTEKRYTGRLFASWFTPTAKLTFIGNVNNLHDGRKPGKNDTWTPDMMPSGTREYRTGAVNYDYENPEETRRFNGYVEIEQSALKKRTTTARTNFLSGGNTYDNSFSRARDRRLRIVNYAVNASGRTVSYSNALRRYLLFSVQYRLSIQPKKRR